LTMNKINGMGGSSLDRIEKLAEWRGKVQTTLEIVQNGIEKMDTTNANDHVVIKRSIDSAVISIKEMVEEQNKKYDKISKRVNSIYTKVVGLGVTVGAIMYVILQILSIKVI